jgi:hypothetical protein
MNSNMKICTKCKEIKELSEFTVRRRPNCQDRLYSWCKTCSRCGSKAWAVLNADRLKAVGIDYRNSHREQAKLRSDNFYRKNAAQVKARTAIWAKTHKEIRSAIDSKWYYENIDKKKTSLKAWVKANPAKVNATNARRRAAKLKRTPFWLTENDYILIRMKYQLASYLTEETGIKWAVDHIYPLQGENISGLHVPSNLRVIPFSENSQKKNKII